MLVYLCRWALNCNDTVMKGLVVNRKFHFTEKTLRELPTPEKRIVYKDAKNHTLHLFHEPTGRKTFYSRIWSTKDSKTIPIPIGTFPAWTPEKARKQDNENVFEVQNGNNPIDKKQNSREEITFGELFFLLREQEFSARRPATIETYDFIYKNHLKRWASKRLSEISSKDVLGLRNDICVNKGRYAANSAIRLLTVIFKLAVRYTGFNSISPTTGIAKYREEKRVRRLEKDDIVSLLASIEAEPDETMRDIFLILFFTGARKGNVLSMSWENIDLKNSIWSIPSSSSKNHESFEVVLSDEALKVLRKRRLKAGGCPWVFSAESKSGHVVSISKAKKRILEKAGIENFRTHDFRHAFASMQIDAGVDPISIQQSLAHRDFQSTLRYVHIGRTKRKEAVDAVSGFVKKAKEEHEQKAKC